MNATTTFVLAVRCVLRAACCVLHGACCVLHVAVFMLRVEIVHAVCLHCECCILHAACCMAQPATQVALFGFLALLTFDDVDDSAPRPHPPAAEPSASTSAQDPAAPAAPRHARGKSLVKLADDDSATPAQDQKKSTGLAFFLHGLVDAEER